MEQKHQSAYERWPCQTNYMVVQIALGLLSVVGGSMLESISAPLQSATKNALLCAHAGPPRNLKTLLDVFVNFWRRRLHGQSAWHLQSMPRYDLHEDVGPTVCLEASATVEGVEKNAIRAMSGGQTMRGVRNLIYVICIFFLHFQIWNACIMACSQTKEWGLGPLACHDSLAPFFPPFFFALCCLWIFSSAA